MSSKLRIYDSTAIISGLNTVVQVKHQIESILEANDMELSDTSKLPDSSIPTSELYALCVCYEAMFSLLEKYELIKDAHLTPSKVIH